VPSRAGRHGAFGMDEDAALAELEKAWAGGGWHGFSVPDGSLRAAVSSPGRGAHGQHAGRAGPGDPHAPAGTAMSG